MSNLYHEHHDALVGWPWKLFCAKWVRLIVRSTKDWEERHQQDITREEQAQQARLGNFASRARGDEFG